MSFINLSSALVADATHAAANESRSVSGQIEYWARIGKAALDNPDLPAPFIRDTLQSLEETRAGKTVAFRHG